MYAYTDAQGNVLATYNTQQALATVQATRPTVTAEIASAPATIAAKDDPGSTIYHRKISGDGASEAHYIGVHNLPGIKALKIAQISAKTADLLGSATFDFDGYTFCLDAASVTKWIALKAMSDVAAVWPVTVSAKTGEYSLAQANVAAFATAGFNVVQGIKDAGRALRLQVEAAADVAAVAAIQDNR